jgi:hypothetical protein
MGEIKQIKISNLKSLISAFFAFGIKRSFVKL